MWGLEVHEDIGPNERHSHEIRRVLCEGRTAVQSFCIADLAKYGRAMIIDGRLQSTERDEYIYHQSLIYPTYVLRPPLRRVLCIGGANGGMLRELRKLPGLEEAIVLDVDRELFELSRQYLPHMHEGADLDPLFRLEFGEIRELFGGLEGDFDAIFADLPDALAGSATARLFTVEFYRTVRGRLGRGGVFATQAGPATHLDCAFFASVLRTARSTFRHAAPYSICVPSYGVPWGFVIASDEHDPASLSGVELARRAAPLEALRLRAYDATTHEHMFLLPRALREALGGGRLSEDRDPVAACPPAEGERRP